MKRRENMRGFQPGRGMKNAPRDASITGKSRGGQEHPRDKALAAEKGEGGELEE
jgi:hypothetical protein